MGRTKKAFYYKVLIPITPQVRQELQNRADQQGLSLTTVARQMLCKGLWGTLTPPEINQTIKGE